MVRLAILSVALAVATMEIALSFVQGFESEIENKVAGFAAHIVVTNYGQEISSEILPLTYQAQDIARIEAIEEVASVAPFAIHTAMIRSRQYWEGVQLKGVDSSYHWDFLARAVVDGDIPNFTGSEMSNEVLISRKIARRLALEVGDKAELIAFVGNDIEREATRVAGIYETGLEEFDNTTVIADMRLVQMLRGWSKSQVAGYEVNTHRLETDPHSYWDWSSWPFFHRDSVSSLDNTTLDVSAVSPDFLATPVTYTFIDIFDWLKLQHQNVWVILILMMIVAIINMTSVILIIIIERTRTVGILKSMGMQGRHIRRMFVWYAMLLILVGVILGNILGLGLLYSQHSLEWLQVNQEDYFITTVPVAWVWGRFLFINLGVILICTLAMYLPGMVVQRITPVRAIRFE